MNTDPADIDAMRKRIDDAKAQLDNVFPLLVKTKEMNRQMAVELQHYARQLEDTRDSADAAELRVTELELENRDLIYQLATARSERDTLVAKVMGIR